jgi:hypothetical protein
MNVTVTPGSTLYVPANSSLSYAVSAQACPPTVYNYPSSVVEFRDRELTGMPKVYHDIGFLVFWALAVAIVVGAVYGLIFAAARHASLSAIDKEFEDAPPGSPPPPRKGKK